MSLKSFLDWFEGFSENIEMAPTEKQWAKIKERIERLKSEPLEVPSAVVLNGSRAGSYIGNAATPVAAPAGKPLDQMTEAEIADLAKQTVSSKGGGVTDPRGGAEPASLSAPGALRDLYAVNPKKADKLYMDRVRGHLRKIDSTITEEDAKAATEGMFPQYDMEPEKFAEMERASWRT